MAANIFFFRCCAAIFIGLSFGKRLDTNFLRHPIRKYPDLPVHISDSLRIYLFTLWRADLKMSGFAVELPGCVWTEAVRGKKMLRIQKYPNMPVDGVLVPLLPYIFFSNFCS